MADDRLPRDPLMREAMALAARPARPFIHLRVHSAYSLLEGALPLSKIVAPCGEGFGAGHRRHRHQQSVRRAGIRPEGGEGRRAADHRLPARFRLSGQPRGGVAHRTASRHGPALLSAGPDRRHRGRLRQSGAAGQPRLSRQRRPARPCICRWRCSTAFAEGIICLTGGPRGPIGAALKGDHPAAGRGAAAVAEGPVRRPALCRDRAARRLRPRARGGDHRPRLPPRSAAGRHQRGLLPDARGFRRA